MRLPRCTRWWTFCSMSATAASNRSWASPLSACGRQFLPDLGHVAVLRVAPRSGGLKAVATDSGDERVVPGAEILIPSRMHRDCGRARGQRRCLNSACFVACMLNVPLIVDTNESERSSEATAASPKIAFTSRSSCRLLADQGVGLVRSRSMRARQRRGSWRDSSNSG
jgi:hypothetical protein